MTEEKKGIEEYESSEQLVPKVRMWVRATKKVQVKDYEPQEFGSGIEEIFDRPLSRQEKSEWQSNNFRICNENVDEQFRIAKAVVVRDRDMDTPRALPTDIYGKPLPLVHPQEHHQSPKPDILNVRKELGRLLGQHQLPMRVWRDLRDIQKEHDAETLNDTPENVLLDFWDRNDLSNLKKEKDE